MCTTINGFEITEMGPREDGVLIASGIKPNGETFENLVVVAAYVTSVKYGEGDFKRGDEMPTSMGPGILLDFCEEAMNISKAGGGTHFDIYALWKSEPYVSMRNGDIDMPVVEFKEERETQRTDEEILNDILKDTPVTPELELITNLQGNSNEIAFGKSETKPDIESTTNPEEDAYKQWQNMQDDLWEKQNKPTKSEEDAYKQWQDMQDDLWEKQNQPTKPDNNDEQYNYGLDITYNPTEERKTDGIYVDGYKAYIPDTVGTDNMPKTIIIDFHGKNGGNQSYEQIAENGLLGTIEGSDLAKPNAYIITPKVNPNATNQASPWVANKSADEIAKIIDEFLAEQQLNRDDVQIIFSGSSSGGQASLYMGTKLPEYCDGIITMDPVAFDGYQDTIPEIKVPIAAYGGTQSTDGFHQKMNQSIDNALGEDNGMTIIESNHSSLPKNVYNLDENNNGIPDVLEKFMAPKTEKVEENNLNTEGYEAITENETMDSYEQWQDMQDDLYDIHIDNTNRKNILKELENVDNLSEEDLEKIILRLAISEGIDIKGKTSNDLLSEIANKYAVSLTNTNFLDIPLYNQMEYADVKYGYGDDAGTIRSSGCGIAAYAMVLSYLLDREILPCDLVVRSEDDVDKYHKNYNTYYIPGQGSDYTLFTQTAEKDWGISVEQMFDEAAFTEGKLEEALRNGQPVIAKVKSNSPFTNEGHYIVLTGITEDGRVLVNDPNGFNYESNLNVKEEGALKDLLVDGGFDLSDFRNWASVFFVFENKDTSDSTGEITKPVSDVLGEISDKIQDPLFKNDSSESGPANGENLNKDNQNNFEDFKDNLETGTETDEEAYKKWQDMQDALYDEYVSKKGTETEEEHKSTMDDEMPYYNQREIDYRINGYSMADGGCGLCAYAMALSYLRDEEITPERLADKYYGPYYAKGTAPDIFRETPERDWGISVTEVTTWSGYTQSSQIMDALENDQPIIAFVDEDSPFLTEDPNKIKQHYVVLSGLTEDGQIKVKDPNGNVYGDRFDPEDIFADGNATFFIFESKEDVSSRPQKDLDDILTEEPKGTYGEKK